MAENFADRLNQAIQLKRTPVCVGIDPVYSRLPAELRPSCRTDVAPPAGTAVEAIREFSRRVIRAVSPIVPCVKINSAYFERYRAGGVQAYYDLVEDAAAQGLIVIGDCKRGDVGHTAEQYAAAHLTDPVDPPPRGPRNVDAVTLHSFLGVDALHPFVDVCRRQGKGLFILVQTSNPLAERIQGFVNAHGESLSEHAARMVHELAGDEALMGSGGYSAVGAVVAPRDPELTARLRQLMPRSLFLVPGYGAQGAGPEDVARCFNADGTGALVNASRSVIYAYDDDRYQTTGNHWEQCIEAACRDFANSIARTVRM